MSFPSPQACGIASRLSTTPRGCHHRPDWMTWSWLKHTCFAVRSFVSIRTIASVSIQAVITDTAVLAGVRWAVIHIWYNKGSRCKCEKNLYSVKSSNLAESKFQKTVVRLGPLFLNVDRQVQGLILLFCSNSKKSTSSKGKVHDFGVCFPRFYFCFCACWKRTHKGKKGQHGSWLTCLT